MSVAYKNNLQLYILRRKHHKDLKNGQSFIFITLQEAGARSER